MKITQEMSLREFDFWMGARDFVEHLTDEELDTIEAYFDQDDESFSATDLNDIFWFDRDYICSIIGVDEDTIWNRDKQR